MLWWIKITYGKYFDAFILDGSVGAPILVMIITLVLVRVHPEPADACCKCFEDGVAFAGVFIGVKFGQWRNPVAQFSIVTPSSGFPPLLSVVKILLKIFLGWLPLDFKSDIAFRCFSAPCLAGYCQASTA